LDADADPEAGGDTIGHLAKPPEFYPPVKNADDKGPTTAERMEVYQRHAASLGAAACLKAFGDGGVSPKAITHLVTVSCTGFGAPGFDVQLIDRLGLCPDVSRTHIGFMGCHGAMNGMRVARAFASADPQNCVLLCAVELCSLHHQYGFDPDSIVANALFADGAGAIILGGIRGSQSSSDGGLPYHASLRHIASGATIIDQTQDQMSWQIGDHGFKMTLAATVPELIRQHLRSWLSSWLQDHSLAIEDIGGWIVHPGGPRVLEATADALALLPDALDDSFAILRDYGNMSSPTVLFVLQRAIAEGREGPFVMLGFGPGLAIEAALLGE
jgi:predicted naringenin-chalcone synthase